MKHISLILIVSSLAVLSFTSCKTPAYPEITFDLENYVTLHIEQLEYEGQIHDVVSAQLIDIKDSIGTIIHKTPRRYEYLLTNRLHIDSLSNVMPDSLKAKAMFTSYLERETFKDYFFKTFYANAERPKEIFTEAELMKVASKFFLAENYGGQFITKICVGINGLGSEDLKHKDYTLLEAIVYEAIFERLMQKSSKEPLFMTHLNTYSKKAINAVSPTTKDALNFIRTTVFEAMENDAALKTHLLNYFNKNQANIAIEIVK